MNQSGVNLFYEYEGGGPGKVVKNLIKGLQELNIPCVSNDFENKEHYAGVLQSITDIHNKNLSYALFGPNLFVLPPDWGENCQLYEHYIVPSQWVKDKYQTFWTMQHATIDIWAVGIDTEFWNCNVNKTKNKCLIYIKNRRAKELAQIINYLTREFINYEIIEYGYYTEQELFDICMECNFAILLTGTESQGIGYMEILSMGLPCYVCNKSIWDINPHYGPFNATSVPYFDEHCGVISNTFDDISFSKFIENLNSFSPRKYICDEFTLKQKANEYYTLLQKYYCFKPPEITPAPEPETHHKDDIECQV